MKQKFHKWVMAAMLLPTLAPLTAQAQADAVVKGTVHTEEGQPLTGVSISLKGTSLTATTDAQGHFSLTVPNMEGKIVFSYLGYSKKEVDADEDIDVTLSEDGHTLGDVIITTQKRRQTRIEVPVAVSALSGENLAHLNVQQLDQMAEFVPGLEVQIQSPNNPGYVIRGVTSDGGESYSQPRISAFMDGVSISRSRASAVELFDIERVEVVKGPQGTLFGRGAEIGAMHILRNRPTDELGGEISLNYGTHNQRGASGFLNTPIIKGKLANRLAFSYDAHDGYIKNLSGGRLNGKSAWALRNSTRLFAGEKTTLNLVLDYQHDNYPGTSFKSNRLAPIGGDTSPYTAASLERGKDLGIRRDLGGATFLVDHTFSPALKLSSITGFRAFRSDEKFDADGTYLRLLDCREKAEGTQFSQELRLNYDKNERFSGFVGVSYFYENSRQEVSLATNMQQLYPTYIQSQYQAQISTLTQMVPMLGQMLGLPAASQQALSDGLTALQGKWFPTGGSQDVTNLPTIYTDLSNLLSTATGGLLNLETLQAALASGAYDTALSQAGLSREAVQTGLATLKATDNVPLETEYNEQSTNYGINQAAEIFADATVKIVKGLSFTAGLRGTYEHQKTGYSSTTVPHAVFGAIMYQPTNGRVYASDDYLSWVGRAALNYMFGRNNAYISVSRGRRPGVISFNNSGEDLVKLKPEIIVSYEAGIKGSVLDGRLGYEFCTYYYDWSHFQTMRLDDASSTLARNYVADDAGRAHSFGIEAGLRYAFTRNISVFGNYSYIDGKFNDKDGDGNEQEYAGNRFRLTPKHSFALGLDLNFPVAGAAEIYFRPSYSYKSKVYFEDDNDPELTQGGYGLLNFNAGFRKKTAKFYYEVSLYGKNVLNEDYLIDAGNSGRAINYPTFVAGSPSVFGLQIKIGF